MDPHTQMVNDIPTVESVIAHLRVASETAMDLDPDTSYCVSLKKITQKALEDARMVLTVMKMG